jgi:hypothetical protein
VKGPLSSVARSWAPTRTWVPGKGGGHRNEGRQYDEFRGAGTDALVVLREQGDLSAVLECQCIAEVHLETDGDSRGGGVIIVGFSE